MSKKDEYLKFKNFEKKVKSPFMIYAYFESILVPKDNGKQNPNESYVNKYEKNVACSYGYKLVCVDDKFSKPFKSYLDEDVVYNFISRMIEASKYYSDVIKTILTKNLWWLKKIMKILRTLLNAESLIMLILTVMLKLKIIVISLGSMTGD